MVEIDTLILGAGAAGLFCGARTAARGRRTLVIDHARKPAEKVRISGGGRCNFTNMHTAPSAFISENPHFAKSALARYTPWDFCDLMAAHGLSWHEKTLGQLFCDQKSGAVIQMLLDELSEASGELRLETEIHAVEASGSGFRVSTSAGEISTQSLVIATGGLSIPKMGATRFAYDIAAQFDHALIETRPALVPLIFTGKAHDDFASISGVSTPVEASTPRGPSFAESLLFTHRGLSGPAILQISSYWHSGESITLDLVPGQDAAALLSDAKAAQPKATISAILAAHLPKRLVDLMAAEPGAQMEKRLAEMSKADLETLARRLNHWTLTPVGSEGWRTAEVTAGGISTDGLSSRDMQSKHHKGLYFIGECVDVTGWLGGYNFQWAWASAAAAAETA